MGILRKRSVGYAIAPAGRTRAADVVAVQSILALLPRAYHHYVGESLGPTRLLGGDLPLVINATYEGCPEVDVLVVGEVAEDALRRMTAEKDTDDAGGKGDSFLGFVRERAERAEIVVGISTGVLALVAAGVLKGAKVTAGKSEAKAAMLSEMGAIPILPSEDGETVIVHDKFYTAGPSTGAMEVAFKILSVLGGEFVAKFAELNQEYDPVARYGRLAAPAPDVLSKAWEEAGAKPLKVGVILPAEVYVPDVMGAVDVLSRLPKAEFHYLWTVSKRSCQGSLGPRLITDSAFDVCPQMDVLVMGLMMPHISNDADLLSFLHRQAPAARAVIATCAGALALGGAGLLDGRRAATNFHMLHLLKYVGAVRSDDHVVADGKFHTAGPAVGSYEAALRVVETLYGVALAREVESELLEFRPRPLYGVGTPEKAGRWLTLLSRLFLVPLLPLYRWYATRGYRRSLRMIGKCK